MWKSLSPSLLLIALGSVAAPLAAADRGERHQGAAAVMTFVEQRMRLPAKRWLDEWLQARHQDEGQWYEKVLRMSYAERFADLTPDKAEAERLKKDYLALRAEIDKAIKDKRLPEGPRELMGSARQLDRLKKEIIAIMDPNLPPPQVPLVPEKKALVQRLIQSLADQATVEFAEALATAKAHIAGPEQERIKGRIPDGPKGEEIDNLSVSLRSDALQALVTAHSVLRDVYLRAKDFGIEPSAAVADAWLEKTAKAQLDLVATWDYEWGPANPYLHFYCLVWMGEAVRQGVKTYKDGKLDTRLKFEDVESKLAEIISTDTTKVEREWRDEMIGSRFRAMDQLMRWCVEMTKVKPAPPVPPLRKLDPKNKNDKHTPAELALQRELREARDLSPKEVLQRALEMWRMFQDMGKKDATLTLAGAPKQLQVDIGFMYLSAARMFLARKDTARAAGLLGEVINAKNMHPGIREYAKMWVAAGSQDGPRDGGWGDPSTPMDPSSALMIAQQLYRAADETIDKKLQEQSLVRAAVMLRNGISGLDNRVYAEHVVPMMPKVYGLYVAVLVKLGLRQHAAIAGTEGLDRIVAVLDREEKAKKPNPWKTLNDGKDWVMVTRLAKETNRLAKNIYAYNKGFGTIVEAARNFQVKIDPNSAGPDNDIDEIFQLIQDRRNEEAIAKCKEFLAKYPAAKHPKEELVVFSMLVNARLGLLDKLDPKSPQAIQISKDMDQDNAAMLARIKKELEEGKPTPERKRDLERTQTAILSCDIALLMRNKKYDEVLKRLGPDFWKKPPSDPSLSVNMLVKMCQACGQRFMEVNRKPDKDVILAAATDFQQAYESYAKQAKRLSTAGVDADLRKGARILYQVFLGTAQLAAQLKAQEPRFAEIEAAAYKGYADLFEPLIDDKTKPNEVWLVADVLWDMGERERAAVQFERYQGLLAKDEELQAFKADAKKVIDGYGARINVRNEFKALWDEVVDLAWDAPEFIEAIRNDLPDTKGRIASYGTARRKLDELAKGPVVKVRDVMKKEDHAAVLAAIKECDRLLSVANLNRQVMSRLALAFRDAGRQADALKLFQELYNQDPTNPEYASAVVEVTLQSIREGKTTAKDPEGRKQIDRARAIVAKVRNDLERDARNRDGYWLAYIQGQELTAALGEIAQVNDTLSFLRVNKSDVSRDLIKPAVAINRADGTSLADDPRCRRPRNVQAIQLAERFLALFTLNGVKEKPAFRIGKVEGLTPPEVFIDAGVQDFALIMAKDENDDQVGLLLPPGTNVTAAPAPAADAPVPTPAPAPTPAADAPAPAPTPAVPADTTK